jgi:hypothetical protein
VIPNVAFTLVYPISEDRDAYLLPTYAATSIAGALGIHALVTRPAMSRRAPAVLAMAVVTLLPVVPFVANLPYENRRNYFAASDYADAILATVGSNGLVLTYDWEVYSPLLYRQEVERHRSDVVAIDANLLRRSWYFGYLERRYPTLIDGARESVDLYLADLTAWEHNPALYAQPELNRRIEERYQGLLSSLVRVALESGPAYTTQEIALEGNTAQLLAREYSLVPTGLILRLFLDPGFHEPVAAQVALRGLTDGTVSHEPDDVARQQVLPAVLRSLELRGLYYQAFGRTDSAQEAFAEADQLRSRLGL